MVIPSENPIVAVNVPLVLDRPRGTDASAEALRNALLGVAAIHQSFLSRSTVTQEGATNMLRLALTYRIKSKQLLVRACTTAQGTQ